MAVKYNLKRRVKLSTARQRKRLRDHAEVESGVVDFLTNMISIENAKLYCNEDVSLIENYEQAIADQSQIWDCHHKAEILPCGVFSVDDLERHGLYWKQPAERLIFLPPSEHSSLHHANIKDSTRQKLSDVHKGKPSWNKGKKCPSRSEETRRKISQAMRGKRPSEEARRKMSEARKRFLAKTTCS